jgi:hypothetical protein
VRHGFHDVLLADPLEAAGAAKSVERARDLMFDAVHMKPVGFAALAGKFENLFSSGCYQRSKRAAALSSQLGSGPGPIRPSEAGVGLQGSGRREAAQRVAGRSNPDPDPIPATKSKC